jgi:hypothetical protein
MEKLQLEVKTDNNELIIREGSALKVHNPLTLDFDGTITAPGNWFEGKDGYDLQYYVAIVDIDAQKIVLEHGDHAPFGKVRVTGQLSIDPQLKQFGINQRNKTYTTKQLARLLKMNRINFEDREENLQIVSNLETFKARVTLR